MARGWRVWWIDFRKATTEPMDWELEDDVSYPCIYAIVSEKTFTRGGDGPRPDES